MVRGSKMAMSHVEADSDLLNDALTLPEGSKVINKKEITAENKVSWKKQ